VRLVGIGLVAGLFSAVFGVGGGLVAVPLLVMVAHVGERPATAISLGAIGITALGGTIVYATLGYVDPGHAALVGLPAAVGAAFGTALQQRLTVRALTLAFAALLAGIGVWFLVG
jgi:uncharacterized membrane protein YfcA